MTLKYSIVLDVTASLPVSTTPADVRIGFIGSLGSDTGLSILCGVGIAVEGTSTVGGMSGEELTFVSADIGEDITEGVKACEYLAETEEIDFIVSGSIDNVSPGWLPRMQEFQIPTLDAWTSYIDTTDMVIKDPEVVAPRSMNIASGEALATLYINFGADVLKKEMGWDSVTTLAKDTASGEAVTGPATKALGPVAGVEAEGIITYDVGTVDFASLFSKVQALEADFIHQVNSANSQVTPPQYVKLQAPMAMTDVDVSALGLECWGDTGGAGGDISTLSPIPSVGFELDSESQKFVDTHQAKCNSHSKTPHFNGFNTYWGLKQAVTATEATGSFSDAKVWSAEMREQDIMLKKDGKMWLCYTFWGDDEVEEVTGRTYLHNARFGLAAPHDDARPSVVVIQWKEDGEVGVVYPPEYVTIKFTVSSWVE